MGVPFCQTLHGHWGPAVVVQTSVAAHRRAGGILRPDTVAVEVVLAAAMSRRNASPPCCRYSSPRARDPFRPTSCRVNDTAGTRLGERRRGRDWRPRRPSPRKPAGDARHRRRYIWRDGVDGAEDAGLPPTCMLIASPWWKTAHRWSARHRGRVARVAPVVRHWRLRCRADERRHCVIYDRCR